jgi:hypothetical protein
MPILLNHIASALRLLNRPDVIRGTCCRRLPALSFYICLQSIRVSESDRSAPNRLESFVPLTAIEFHACRTGSKLPRRCGKSAACLN